MKKNNYPFYTHAKGFLIGVTILSVLVFALLTIGYLSDVKEIKNRKPTEWYEFNYERSHGFNYDKELMKNSYYIDEIMPKLDEQSELYGRSFIKLFNGWFTLTVIALLFMVLGDIKFSIDQLQHNT